MKIEIHFRDKLLGTGQDNGGQIAWEGNLGAVRPIVSHYQRQGYEGEALLKVLLEKLRGNTWAQEVKG